MAGRAPTLALAMATALALAAPATAQPTAESARLFEEGRALAKAGKHAEACERFAQSLAIVRAPGTTLNRGDCLERLGQLVEARAMFDEAARDLAAARDPRAAFARERRDALTARLVTVEISVEGPALAGLVLEVGDVTVAPAATVVVHVEPGDIAIRARAPGHAAVELARRGAAGEQVAVAVPALVPARGPEEAAAPVGGATAGAAPPRRQRAYVYGAIGAGTLGVIALGASGLLGASAAGIQDDAIAAGECARIPAGQPDAGRLGCTAAGTDALARAGRRADLATLSAVGGVALAGGALALYLLAPRERVTVAPVATASSVGVTLSAAF